MDAKRTLCIPKKSVIRDLKSREGVLPVERVELPTFGLQNRCSTAELNRLKAIDWIDVGSIAAGPDLDAA